MPHDTPSQAYRTLLYHAALPLIHSSIPLGPAETLNALGRHSFAVPAAALAGMN